MSRKFKSLWRIITGAGGPVLSRDEINKIRDRREVHAWANEDTFAFVKVVRDAKKDATDESDFVARLNNILFSRGSVYSKWRNSKASIRRDLTLDKINGVTLARNVFVTSFVETEEPDLLTPWGYASSTDAVSGFLIAKCMQEKLHIHGVFSFACPVPLVLIRHLNPDKHIEPLMSKYHATRYIESQAVNAEVFEYGEIASEGAWENRDPRSTKLCTLRRDAIDDFPAEYIEDVVIRPNVTDTQLESILTLIRTTDKLCLRVKYWNHQYKDIVSKEATINNRLWYIYYL